MMIEYSEARERFFKAINDRPEDIDLIAHNAAAVMLMDNGIRWPDGMDVEKRAVAIEAFFLEFWRRWQWARVRKSEDGQSAQKAD